MLFMSVGTGGYTYVDIPVSPVWYAFLINTVHDTKCYLCLLALADIDIPREPCVVCNFGECGT